MVPRMMYTWILSLIVSLMSAEVPTPWVDTYADTAHEIADAVDAIPLPGERGAEHMAVVLVAIGFYESRFQPDAAGDCGGKTPSFANCQSIGAWQISKANGKPTAANAARLVRTSWNVCKEHPITERLAWYAAGFQGCSKGLGASRGRMNLALYLMRSHPPPSPLAADDESVGR